MSISPNLSKNLLCTVFSILFTVGVIAVANLILSANHSRSKCLNILFISLAISSSIFNLTFKLEYVDFLYLS